METLTTHCLGDDHLRKVLLVEDDDLQLRIRAAILTAAGFEVVTYSRAEDALPVITESHKNGHQQSVSVVITDHLLPGMSGLEFVRHIRAIDQRLPVIVLSGLPDAHLDYEGLDIVFRQKPCPPADIIDLVRHSFDHAA